MIHRRRVFMHGHLLRVGTAFTLAMIGCCWGSQVTTPAMGSPMNMNDDRNKVRETMQKQFVAEKVMALRVRDDSGDIRVTADDATNEVAIRAETIVEGRPSVAELKTYLARVQMNTHMEGDTLLVRADYPRDEFSRKRINVSVNYIIAIPKRLALDLLSGSGNVDARGAHGGVQAHSGSGNVTLADIAGTVEATSGSGDVSVKDARVRESLQLDSGSGNVGAEAIRVSGSALTVTMKSGSGNVDFEGDARELAMHSGSGNVTGRVTATLTLRRAGLHSGSGNVALTAPKLVSATIHARTENGSIRLHGISGVTKNVGDDGEGRSRRFTLGSGSAPVTLETNSGDVEFSAR